MADNSGPTRTRALLAGGPGIDDGEVGNCNDWAVRPLNHNQRGRHGLSVRQAQPTL